MPGHYALQAVNFQYVLENSEIPYFYVANNSIAVDLNKDDAFTRALRTIEKNVDNDIEYSKDIQDLLAKDVWDRQDRVEWERFISEAVSKHLAETPGLESYRHKDFDDSTFYNSSVETSANSLIPAKPKKPLSLNDLSYDVETGKNVHEFHCKMMAVTEGIVLQRIENKHICLNEGDLSECNWKNRGNYFLVPGKLFNWDSPGGHCFIVSGLTGNVIEATVGPKHTTSSYMESHDENNSFQSFIDGKTFITSSYDSLYTSRFFHSEFDFINDVDKSGATLINDYSGLFGYDFLRNRLQIGGTNIGTFLTPDITFKVTDTPDIQGLYTGVSAIDFRGGVSPVLFWLDRISTVSQARFGLISDDPGLLIHQGLSGDKPQTVFQTVRPGMEDHHYFVDGLFGAQYQDAIITRIDEIAPYQLTGGVDIEGNPYARGKLDLDTQVTDDFSLDLSGSGSYIGERDTFRVDGIFGFDIDRISTPFNTLADVNLGVRGTHEFSGDDPVSLATTFVEAELYTQGETDFWKSRLSGVFGAYAGTNGDTGFYAGPRLNYGPTSIGVDIGHSEDRHEFIQASLKWMF
ncbi:MAG: hypothetical protein GC137_01075 [Alphaproteobacteria bacterium]|nr:hypothetical protein [Alphaproteobacteria bacterium]